MDDELIQKYESLIHAFLQGTVSAGEFERRYLATFKAEQAPLSPPVFDVLEQLFSDVDAYSPDCRPGEESEFVISESHLRRAAAAALAELERLPAAQMR
ncbi:MAG: colicin immunity domain-containing protein [Chloroflexota bacterium]